jgi:DNA-binding transcriptional MerR regulator
LPLTAKDLAEKIADPDADLQPAIERVRHWTREGLLVPAGDRNPGTGRKRVYDDNAVVSARILNVLADFGIGLAVMRTALILGQDAAKTIAGKKLQGVTCFLIIDKGDEIGPNPLARLFEQPDITLVMPDNTQITLRDRPQMLAGAALIINLTRMLS